ncbi:hypothetical protein [Streptomyces sp. NPDC090445]|uniref:hypothetical protein n=1 Tax=Streptomyces sp. NPDC090445 TaxID=3365963 RepID=UPI00381BCC8E
MTTSSHRAAHKVALGKLLNELPGSDDFFFWHIIETAGYRRPAKTMMVVEPYSDGSVMRRLRTGIEELAREAGDENTVDDLCALLSDLFAGPGPDPALVPYLNQYMGDISSAPWHAEVWLEDLGIAVRGLSAPKDMLALRRKWTKTPAARAQPGRPG